MRAGVPTESCGIGPVPALASRLTAYCLHSPIFAAAARSGLVGMRRRRRDRMAIRIPPLLRIRV
jgi:hypothetical protein